MGKNRELKKQIIKAVKFMSNRPDNFIDKMKNNNLTKIELEVYNNYQNKKGK